MSVKSWNASFARSASSSGIVDFFLFAVINTT
jgi:hypothetical protein